MGYVGRDVGGLCGEGRGLVVGGLYGGGAGCRWVMWVGWVMWGGEGTGLCREGWMDTVEG